MEENQNTSPFQFINEEEKIISTSETKDEIKIDEETTEAFVTGLPDWDLAPPYEVIRRVNRKWLILNG